MPPTATGADVSCEVLQGTPQRSTSCMSCIGVLCPDQGHGSSFLSVTARAPSSVLYTTGICQI